MLRLVQNISGVDVFTVSRSPHNADRGLESSTDDKCESVEKFSIRLEWRSPPWLVLNKDVRAIDYTYDRTNYDRDFTNYYGLRQSWLATTTAITNE